MKNPAFTQKYDGETGGQSRNSKPKTSITAVFPSRTHHLLFQPRTMHIQYRKTPADKKSPDRLIDQGISRVILKIVAAEETLIPPEPHTPEPLDYCFSRYEQMPPVHAWLLEMTRRAGL
jgi:hypothetical protein